MTGRPPLAAVPCARRTEPTAWLAPPSRAHATQLDYTPSWRTKIAERFAAAEERRVLALGDGRVRLHAAQAQRGDARMNNPQPLPTEQELDDNIRSMREQSNDAVEESAALHARRWQLLNRAALALVLAAAAATVLL